MKKIYISGPITNNPNYKNQFKEKFRQLESEYIVLTPLFITANLSWDDFMHIDLAMIEICDVIHMMKGWENSTGAKTELLHAKANGLEVIYE